jgi:hypothetical protein
MANFKDDLLEVAAGEAIEAIVLGGGGWGQQLKAWGDYPVGSVMTWAEALPYVDREYDNGYGSPKCPSTYAWTESRVLFVVQYDGATDVHSLPRNPVDVKPDMPGG